MSFRDTLPDARDGLTRAERVVLWVMHQARAEYGDRYIPTVLIYGRVVEHIDIDEPTFQRILRRLNGTWMPKHDSRRPRAAGHD